MDDRNSKPTGTMEECSLNISDMKEYCGRRFEIRGCATLFVESGFATCKINYQRFPCGKGISVSCFMTIWCILSVFPRHSNVLS